MEGRHTCEIAPAAKRGGRNFAGLALRARRHTCDVCKSVGMRLCWRGDIELMRKCYYAMRNYPPNVGDLTMRGYFRAVVDVEWDGIGGWQF